MVEIRPATSEMVERLCGKPLQRSARAIAAVRDGEVLGICGVHSENGMLVLFSELTDELRKDKRALVRGIREVRKLFEGRSVQALADPEIPGSEVLLEHMGFSEVAERIYEWR